MSSSRGAPPVQWIGYGLSRSRGQWPMTVGGLAQAAKRGFVCGDKPAATNPAKIGDVAYNDEAGECASGGPGASLVQPGDLGGGECSVSCESDYYACGDLLGWLQVQAGVAGVNG